MGQTRAAPARGRVGGGVSCRGVHQKEVVHPALRHSGARRAGGRAAANRYEAAGRVGGGGELARRPGGAGRRRHHDPGVGAGGRGEAAVRGAPGDPRGAAGGGGGGGAAGGHRRVHPEALLQRAREARRPQAADLRPQAPRQGLRQGAEDGAAGGEHVQRQGAAAHHGEAVLQLRAHAHARRRPRHARAPEVPRRRPQGHEALHAQRRRAAPQPQAAGDSEIARPPLPGAQSGDSGGHSAHLPQPPVHRAGADQRQEELQEQADAEQGRPAAAHLARAGDGERVRGQE
mmetsp:Transcript_34619/g.75669  ORF Transcript_34619/g.75669 Transcript_34619/m.75669 type:complete len:288 (-) Transcript_34619:880-1743(-)